MAVKKTSEHRQRQMLCTKRINNLAAGSEGRWAQETANHPISALWYSKAVESGMTLFAALVLQLQLGHAMLGGWQPEGGEKTLPPAQPNRGHAHRRP